MLRRIVIPATAAALALTMLTLAGCGSDGALDHPSGPDELVLRVETSGGLVPPELLFTSLPELSLYGDGALVVPGPQPAIYPGPALPSLVERHVREEGMQAILRAAEQAGLLGPDSAYGLDEIADAPTTTFTVVAGGATHVVSAYALGLEGPGESELEARAGLTAFLDRLRNLDGWLPEGSAGPEQPHRFAALRVLVLPYGPPEPELVQALLGWPLETPLAALGEPWPPYPGGRCAVVAGDELARLLPAAERANALTPWESGAATFSLLFRPLLPDEAGC